MMAQCDHIKRLSLLLQKWAIPKPLIVINVKKIINCICDLVITLTTIKKPSVFVILRDKWDDVFKWSH